MCALLAACDPVFGLDVHVTDPDGVPIERAHLSLVNCPRQNEHPNGAVTALTNAR
jgi:hypothetical protein